jgi:hypothetical protein
MRQVIRFAVCTAAALLVVVASVDAQGARKRERERERERAAPTPPPDRRDRTIAAPGSPFNGRPYWQAMAQCGGIYFRLNTLYSNAAITAKVVKPDPAANVQFTKKSGAARKVATSFFEAAERFLVGDRGLGREQAIVTYDGLATDAGERQKTIEAAEQAIKPCPALYRTCRESFPKTCSDASITAGRGQGDDDRT